MGYSAGFQQWEVSDPFKLQGSNMFRVATADAKLTAGMACLCPQGYFGMQNRLRMSSFCSDTT